MGRKPKQPCGEFERSVIKLLLSAHNKLDRILGRLDVIDTRLEKIEQKLDGGPRATVLRLSARAPEPKES